MRPTPFFLYCSLCILFFLRPPLLSGQDTVAVFFETGSAKIDYDQMEVLNSLPERFNLSDVQRVRFIGMADSVGDLESNYKLSQRRAKSVARYCRKLIPKNIPFRLAALGETKRKNPAESRRVDVVLYLDPASLEDSLQTTLFADSVPAGPQCYYIDRKLLHRSHIRPITQRNQSFIHIEIPLASRQRGVEYFYGTTTETGAFEPVKLNWRRQKTGKRWWAERRYVARIPQESFDQFKLFTIQSPPCDTCSEDFETNKQMQGEADCQQVDRFLMRNIQVKPMFLRLKEVKVRAPREYVDLEDRYFVGCANDRELIWKPKKGLFRKRYYFSRLPRNQSYIENITRQMKCCEEKPEPSQCDYPFIRFCRPGGRGRGFSLGAEVGNNFHQGSHLPYIMAGVNKVGAYHWASLMVGTDLRPGLYASARYRHFLLDFPLVFLIPGARWQKPSAKGVQNVFGSVFVGTELRTSLRGQEDDFLEHNLHLGFAFENVRSGALIPHVFIHQGIALDYFRNNDTGLYFPLQVGVNVNLIRLTGK